MNKMKLLSAFVSVGLLVPAMSFAIDEQEDKAPASLKKAQKEQRESGSVETMQSAIDKTFAVGVCTAAEALPLAGVMGGLYGLRICLSASVPATAKVFCHLCKGIIGVGSEDKFGGSEDALTALVYGGAAVACATIIYVSEQAAVRYIPSFYNWLRRSKMTKEAVDKHAPTIAKAALKTAVVAAAL